MTDVQVTDRDREVARWFLVDDAIRKTESFGLAANLACVLAQVRAEGFAAGVAQEREACAKAALQHERGWGGLAYSEMRASSQMDWTEACESVAAAIRARGGRP